MESSRLDEALAGRLKELTQARHAPAQSEVTHTEVAPRLLTIGLATYDDFDGAYFTVTSLL